MSVPMGNLYPVPDGVTDEQAAQFSVNPLTVWGLLATMSKAESGKAEQTKKWVINTAAGDSVVGAFDCVGGEVARAVVAATNPGAPMLIYGALGGPTLQINTLDIFLNKKIQPFLLRQYLGSEGQNRQKVFASVMKLIQDGIIKLPSGKRYPLADVRTAAAESLKMGGKEKVFLEG
ncbi:hypothetical protein COCSUDRAFT_55705 [Coccomyxa subellipsoidea C-169]|uniref:NAD(P)-binding protein n=1 Tax=Coccomyxa subellipsoidea (strain C-169) TaxID=574566 RepID=I0ZAQ0_COCSC|nr:hypothetical protein COCSUDRAFT_55705 [Coccomyxa subellipsoidea C-169]EIE27719.1 hypothetical protein COCSUDRAFT_55705 [Coccomyxa subellipsoidea C-169]|eukprot:XP_005652263.1 hypothetical protein COCSUDRAFT_55705 [Coccomyxa subellipsoidea C-169]